jgi:type II secretory pathway pseudopilin PulG
MAVRTGNGSCVRGQGGFTYLGLLFAVAALGIVLATVGVVWSTPIRRDREAQLLWVGDQYRTAIARYRAGGGRLPMALEDLLEDKRFPVAKRYLRQLYPDPMTGQVDWQLIQLPDGSIQGVASSSQEKPIKVANFPARYANFQDAQCYCDWKFLNTARTLRPRRAIRP